MRRRLLHLHCTYLFGSIEPFSISLAWGAPTTQPSRPDLIKSRAVLEVFARPVGQGKRRSRTVRILYVRMIIPWRCRPCNGVSLSIDAIRIFITLAHLTSHSLYLLAYYLSAYSPTSLSTCLSFITDTYLHHLSYPTIPKLRSACPTYTSLFKVSTCSWAVPVLHSFLSAGLLKAILSGGSCLGQRKCKTLRNTYLPPYSRFMNGHIVCSESVSENRVRGYGTRQS
jgi:hypothetical protein